MLLKVESAQPEKQLFIEMTSGITTGNVLPMVEEPRYADFARRLKEAMASKELTVTDVKSELKITYEMARRYTLGIAMPRDERMRKLADFVGRTAAYLQFGDEAQEKPRHSTPAQSDPTAGAIAETAAQVVMERRGQSAPSEVSQSLLTEIANRDIPQHIEQAMMALLQTCPPKERKSAQQPNEQVLEAARKLTNIVDAMPPDQQAIFEVVRQAIARGESVFGFGGDVQIFGAVGRAQADDDQAAGGE